MLFHGRASALALSRSGFACASVFLTVAALAWGYGGIRGEKLWWIAPPAVALLVAALIVGRTRRMLRDPFFWTSLSLIALLAVPFLNTTVRWLPFCINRYGQLNVFLWFAPTLLAALTVRQVMDDADRLRLLELLTLNGFALAIVGWLQLATGARAPLWETVPPGFTTVHFFSTFGYPNMSGDYFTTVAGLAAGLAMHEGGRRRTFFAFVSAVCAASAFASLSRGAIMLCSVLIAAIAVRALFVALSTFDRRRIRRVFAVSTLAVAVAVAGTALLLPKSVKDEFAALDMTKVCARLTGDSQYHVDLALAMWKDHPLFGVGGWGYKYLTNEYAKHRPWIRVQKFGGINVHNDPVQFLAEHGAVGFALMLGSLALLIMPLIGRRREPLVFAILTVCALTTLHSFGDAIFRSPAIMSLYAVILGFGGRG